MKRVVILGCTGSIGESALRVVEALPSELCVVGLAVNSGYERALEQARRFDVKHLAVADAGAAGRCAADMPSGASLYSGPCGVEELAVLAEADIVLCAIVGMAGLGPVLAAIEAGKDVALATKEVLVSAGAIVIEACRRRGAKILPVDSEHSAIFQCLQGQAADAADAHADVRRLILTASGGPFSARADVNLAAVSVGEVLAHPNWNMGRKVTVDSATLMNKGLELLEAHWLFGVPLDRIETVIHPESIVHSMVEFADGSMMAQLSPPDMRFAIQYALTYPLRVDGGLPSLDLVERGRLSFLRPDDGRFPSLRLARAAGERGGTLPAVMNAANEVAVQSFLCNKIVFSGIWETVEAVMDRHSVVDRPALSDIMDADAWARRAATERVGRG